MSLPPLPPQPPENASIRVATTRTIAPGTADRCTAVAVGGRPDSAATIGTRATARAGRRDASVAVRTASTHRAADQPPGQVRPRDTVVRSVGQVTARTRSRRRDRVTAPMSAPTPPTRAPLVTMTRRTLRSVAPSAESMPSARSRRWASTVKPAAATRPTKIRPMIAIANTMTAGRYREECVGVTAAVPAGNVNPARLAAVASNSTVT